MNSNISQVKLYNIYIKSPLHGVLHGLLKGLKTGIRFSSSYFQGFLPTYLYLWHIVISISCLWQVVNRLFEEWIHELSLYYRIEDLRIWDNLVQWLPIICCVIFMVFKGIYMIKLKDSKLVIKVARWWGKLVEVVSGR